jgi:putative heme-binding domain-containing protein
MKRTSVPVLGLLFIFNLSLTGCRSERPAPPALQPQAVPVAGGQKAEFRVPEGFVVEQVASAEQTGSIVNLTFDSKGRPVLSRERGPVVILEDQNNDGKFETVKNFTEEVTNCQGLLFVGTSLYAVGDVFSEEQKRALQQQARQSPSPGQQAQEAPKGVTGLYRVDDNNGDDAGDAVKLIGKVKGGMGEHGPHAVFVGPDGMLYFDIGNHAWPAMTAEPNSPHEHFYEGQLLPSYMDARGHARNIRAPGGTFWRLDAEGERWERVAGGFRNQYDAAFNLMGELFTFDSDMEWDINLPWYRACRTVHVVPGGDYGWRTGSGKWPDYFPDSLPPLNEVGRGSPVGVDFYQHTAFPAKYHDALILGDWSRGRILTARLEKAGGTYKSTVEEFVLGEPINVTDLAVGPDGAIYFSTGGRATDGGLYRVRYNSPQPQPQPANPIAAALAQPQPRSAWGRAALKKLHDESGGQWGEGLQAVVKSAGEPAINRARALELLQVYGPAPGEEMLASLGKDAAWEVRAASTYYLGLHPTDSARRELVSRLKDGDAFVRRRACEALVRTGIHPAMKLNFSPAQDVLPLLNDSDRSVRYAARLLLERTNRNRWREAVLAEKNPLGAIEGLLAVVRTMKGSPDIDEVLAKETALIGANLSAEQKLALLRVIHLTFINDEGVDRSKLYQPIGDNILKGFPAGDWRLDREYARTLAHLQTPGATEKILAALGAEKNPEQQIFYAYCLRNIKGGWKPEQREAVVAWFAKTQQEQWKGGASFTGYLELIWNTWLTNLPHDEQAQARARLAQLAPAAVADAGEFARKAGNQTLSNQELSEYLLMDPMAYRLTNKTMEEGQKAYEKAACVRCHRFGDLGTEVGPDLTDVGRRFKRKDLIEAILYPSKTISDLWQAAVIKTSDGKTYSGVIESQDAAQLVVRLATNERVTIPKSQIQSREDAKTSLMPEGLLSGLTVGEASSLLMFLEKGAGHVPKS